MSELRLIKTVQPARPLVKHRFEKVAVVGLGYVGFPLSIGLADAFETVVGFDISKRRVATLKAGHDYTGEIEDTRITESALRITNDPEDLAEATVYIITVPTPIDDINRPDFSPLKSASEIVGNYLKRGDLVVFESTVYPGVTEDYCGKILSQVSGLTPVVDFNLGYSPERINPGDKKNTLESIVKIVSADTPQALDRVIAVYEKVVHAGLYSASSIKVAEGAKVLENTQRDINIALMNELAVICEKVGISTREVIEAASSKWNFVPFYPGLVGGHCIGVDPYYLAALSEQVGHHPEVILAGRRLNDRMASHVATVALKQLVRRGGDVRAAKVGVFGITFKENVPDIRNSKAIDLVQELQSYALNVLVHDPVVTPGEASRGGIKLANLEEMTDLDMMILTVPHEAYVKEKGFLDRLAADGILMDVKSVYSRKKLPTGCTYWSL